MHGLAFETSICYWQDQPDIYPMQRDNEGCLDLRARSQTTHTSLHLRQEPTDTVSRPLVFLDTVTSREDNLTHEDCNLLWPNTDSKYTPHSKAGNL